jgi:drug/metabolite transporter (DMT)-like permease
VVSIILAVSFLGERLTKELLFGIGLVIVGIILVSIQTEQDEVRKRLTEGVPYAIIFMVLGGVLFFGLKPVSQALGVYLPVLLLRWVSAVVLVIAFFASKPRGASQLNAFPFIIAVAIFDTFANVTYNIGVSFGTVSIVSTIGGLFSAVTILLAWVFLKERLTRHQIIGFFAISAGVAILGFFA